MIQVFFIIICIVYLGITLYASQILSVFSLPKYTKYIFFLVSLLILALTIYFWYNRNKSTWEGYRQYALAALATWLIVCTVISLFLFLEDVFRIGKALTNHNYSIKQLPSRRRFISLIGLGIAAIPFSSILYGIFKGKYNYKVWKYTLYFENLPKSFDGYKITQISDIHCGSFDNYEKIHYGIDFINAQQSDVIFFTGDLVNNWASELNPWKNLFKKLSAKDGVYSILGNHDYGDYSDWNSEEEKKQNLQTIVDTQRNELGWYLLLNEHRHLEKNGDKIAIIGVQNWGRGRFSKYGDLDKAMEDVSDDEFKILLSHDPSHFEDIVLPENRNIQLTLSGHTHGMQCGIEIPNFIKWSPAQWVYKYWGGMYKEGDKYLNVNRGFGYHAIPARIGMPPEITVIELRCKS